MHITKTSTLTGVRHTRDLPVTVDQLSQWIGGTSIQDAMPELSADDREFLISGITPEEWDEKLSEPEPERYDIIEEPEDGGEDITLESNLSKSDAEQRLCRYLNMGHDAYLTDHEPSAMEQTA